MSLDKFQQFKLDHLLRKYGITNIDECLELAIESESICKSLTPFDTAFTKFSRDCRELQELALLLEKSK